MLSVGALFAGIGGIELGFEKTGGFETKWFVEYEPYAQAVLRKHWPNVPIYGDIRKIDFKELERVDVLTGGFPCQDISNAGKRVGINGERSGLWKEYLRAISEIRPRYAFVENVSALRNRGLSTVLGDLAEVGYDAEWHCVPASSFGAPHRRDRIFILAYSTGKRLLDKENKQFVEEERGCELQFSKSRSTTNVENSECYRSDERDRKEVDSGKEEGEYSDKSCCAGSGERNVADSDSESLERGGIGRIRQQKEKSIGMFSSELSNACNFDYWKQRKESLREKNRRETWATDAGVLRVANGIPNRVDRIKCCGNAVVPQVAEFFAEMILEKESGV